MAAYPVRSAVPLGVSHKRALYDIRGERHGAPIRAQIRAAPRAALHHSALTRTSRTQASSLPAGSRSRVPVGFAPAGQGALPGVERRAGSGTKKRVPTQGGTLERRRGLQFRRDWPRLFKPVKSRIFKRSGYPDV